MQQQLQSMIIEHLDSLQIPIHYILNEKYTEGSILRNSGILKAFLIDFTKPNFELRDILSSSINYNYNNKYYFIFKIIVFIQEKYLTNIIIQKYGKAMNGLPK